MEKDFLRWHRRKSQINDISRPPFFREREVWFCHVGANVGFEQDGAGPDFLRPVVVVRKFNNNVFWAVPLTHAGKTGEYYFGFPLNGETSVAILSQMRLLDARRLR